MEGFLIVMRVITWMLSIYSFIVFIRLLLTWIPIPQLNRIKEILGSVVDPYLDKFRGISWLRFGAMDFSPILGLVLLSVVINITGTLASNATITLGQVLYILLSGIWGMVSFFLGALIVLLIIRLFVSLANSGGHNSWGNLDSLIYNLMARVVGIFTSKSVSFHAGLLITIACLIILRVGFGILMPIASGYLLRL
ncbi:MAG: YggT family protein [Spirochaetaceae bacterium]|jgi:YggT family protein|nr:YggT family protein [Spirochaetaceae bacterium]